MFFLYEVILVLSLLLFFTSYSKAQVSNKIKDLQHQNIIISNLIDTIDDGFYVWDEKKRIEIFSSSFLTSLNTVFYSFNEFVNFFCESEDLSRNFSEARQINKSFIMNLKAKDSEIYCICYGRSIIDNFNNIIGALIWVRNISDHMIKINDYELRNAKYIEEIKCYKNIFNVLSCPIWKENHLNKVTFYNSFYDQYIKNAQKIEVHNSTLKRHNPQLTGEIKRVLTRNECKTYHFIKIPLPSKEIIIHGEDVTYTESLQKKIDYYLITQKNLIEWLHVPIVIYGRNQKLKFYNNAFTQTFHVDLSFLTSYPTYHETISYLFEHIKLITKEDFLLLKAQGHTLFTTLLEPYNKLLHLTNGKIFRVLIMPYVPNGLLFCYEEYKK
ncbi:hypothetical protein [Wolbachia endosymbiont of Pentidionis agamae]|uniref:hypothetical protein n=1 Tax=Wolbachia endosymbiont of Pentidionis agamae TaxID=3110435 RepID=UPI002FD0DEEF